jgi:DNA-binding CsgD family transcriptional regulator
MVTSLRRTGLSVLGDKPWGAHVCVFYESKDDLLDTVVPYFKAGLENNEFCVWAMSELLTVQEGRAALSQDIPAIDRYLAAGTMEMFPGREWYLASGRFNLKRIVRGWHEKLRGALAKGHDGIRISGDTAWLNSDSWKEFGDYEKELNKALADRPMIVLCTYSLVDSSAVDILEVAHAHQHAIVRRKGDWEAVDAAEMQTTPHSITPREIEALEWVARGKSASEIGGILHITKRTVDEHVQTATRKLGAENRTQAVAIALRDGIIKV